jgi:hypothetical protein
MVDAFHLNLIKSHKLENKIQSQKKKLQQNVYLYFRISTSPSSISFYSLLGFYH